MWHTQWLYCLEEAVNPLRDSSLRSDSYVDDYLICSHTWPLSVGDPATLFQNIICKDLSDPVTVEIIPGQNLFQVHGDGHTHRFSFLSSSHGIVSFKACLSLMCSCGPVRPAENESCSLVGGPITSDIIASIPLQWRYPAWKWHKIAVT